MKKLALVTMLASTVLLASCSEGEASKLSISFYKDPKTSCQYVIYAGGYGVSMVQRMNPDGSQMCDK